MAVSLSWAGAVLAGGASSRMGVDKAFIEVAGAPMVVRAVEALRAAGATSAVVVGGDQSRLDALALEALADRCPGQGPLGGVITALADAGDGIAAVVTLPCDVVNPDGAAVRCVVDALAAESDTTGAEGADLVVPVGGGVPQWMHAGWRGSCLPRLEEAFAAGVRAPKDAARRLRTVTVDIPGTEWFRDADRPGDLPAELRWPPARS